MREFSYASAWLEKYKQGYKRPPKNLRALVRKQISYLCFHTHGI